jgi:DNA processing protein
MNEKTYLWLALSLLSPFSPFKLCQFIQNFNHPREIFSLKCQDLQKLSFKEDDIKLILSKNIFKIADQEIKHCVQNQIKIINFESDDYPYLLREIPDFPLVLFYQGNLEVLKDHLKLSVVGSRKISNYGTSLIDYFIPDLVSNNITIISGYALGTDIKAHLSTIKNQGRTIAVLPSGLNYKYPRSHYKYEDRILSQGGFLTEMPFNSRPQKYHFPRRNRIISGLSKASLIIEAAKKSGALITAYLAMDQNREVMTAPGSIFNSHSEGCNHLIQEGAIPVIKVEDILDILGIENISTHKTVLDNKTLDKTNRKIINLLSDQALSIDEISQQINQSVKDSLTRISYLELNNRIELLEGGRYQSKPCQK